jgi:hypothetical protein
MLTDALKNSYEFMVVQAAIAGTNFAIGAFTVEHKAMEALDNKDMVTRLEGALSKAKADRKFAMSLFETLMEGNFNSEEDFKKCLDIVHAYNSLIDHSLINSRSAFLPLGAVPHLRFDRYEEQ